MPQVSVLYFCFSTLIIIFLFANYVIIVSFSVFKCVVPASVNRVFHSTPLFFYDHRDTEGN